MFTGIVQGLALVETLEQQPNFLTLGVRLPSEFAQDLQQGASIAINGVCLTVTSWQENLVFFDVMQETLQLTNLGTLTANSQVNFERAAKIGSEIGGHLMSGHISGQVELLERQEEGLNLRLQFSLPKAWQKYILNKGFVGLNGCSLTLADVEEQSFCVYLIPETRRATTFGDLPVGSQVNLELDPQTQAIVDTVERVLAARGL